LETISGITTGVFAANFVGWLIAYLVTANKVIPQEIKFSHKPLPELKVREKPSKIKAEKKAAKEQAKAEKAAKKAAEKAAKDGTPPTDGEMPATIDEQTTLETSEGTSPPEEEKTVAEDVELIIKENAQ
jgi:hypothetical protein